MSFIYDIPTKTIFGAGKLQTLGDEIKKSPSLSDKKKAIIIISDGKSAKTNGSLDAVIKQITDIGLEWVLFDKVNANPLKAIAEEGGNVARDAGCDFIIALGGGSVLDCSKAIGVFATNGGDLWDYVVGGTGKGLPIKNPGLPIVAIPTTAGTGSETDGGAIISNPETSEKTKVAGPGTIPVLAIVDPELMQTVPAKFKAYQGFDALFHSTEGMISKKKNLVSHMIASEAVLNISRNLARTISDPDDIDAMSKVAFGSWLSGKQMMTGSCIAAHPLEHSLSAYHSELPHGAGLIMIAEAFYRHHVESGCSDDAFIEMAKLMGMEDADKPEDFMTMLLKLEKDCGVDGLKMSDYGITPEEFPKMVKHAKDTMPALFGFDPIELSDEDCIKIYTEAYK